MTESTEASRRNYGFPDVWTEWYLRKSCEVSQKWKIVHAQDGNWDIFIQNSPSFQVFKHELNLS